MFRQHACAGRHTPRERLRVEKFAHRHNVVLTFRRKRRNERACLHEEAIGLLVLAQPHERYAAPDEGLAARQSKPVLTASRVTERVFPRRLRNIEFLSTYRLEPESARGRM